MNPNLPVRHSSRALLAALLLTVALPPAMAPAAPAPAATMVPVSRVDGYCLPEEPGELLRLDDEMRAYFAARVRRHAATEARMDQIVAAILGEAGLHFTYEGDGLYDVREAFRRRRGNCVTFSMLVVAVAREYRIPAQFNEVETRPRWSRTGGLVIESRHLNVRVEEGTCSYEIDLKLRDNLRAGRRSACVVADERAFAGLYSNAGVYRLAGGDRVGAFRLLNRATALDPTFAAGWSNFGTAYMATGETERARRCYERTLVERPGSMAAISGLARIHREAGRLGEAAAFERAAERYRERNPYYLFGVARGELTSGSLEAARDHLARAIRIKRDEPEFYELMVVVTRQLGRASDAARWAERLAGFRREVVAMR